MNSPLASTRRWVWRLRAGNGGRAAIKLKQPPQLVIDFPLPSRSYHPQLTA